MDFIKPSAYGFTIYSKSGCPNCVKIKSLLKKLQLVCDIVDCDDYIIDNKESFLFFIKQLTHKEKVIFPIVFNDAKYIGGYDESLICIDKLFVSFENLDF